jgi:tripartite-type tricarboxylate transporter receptor subunit TctC
MNRRTLLLAALAASASMPAFGQSWPSKPTRIIVPWTPGGSADLLGRLVADHLTAALGQPVIVENRPGATGMTGSAAAAHAEADGSTLVISGIPSHVIAPAITEKPEFDPLTDFTHIAYLGGSPIVLAAHASLGVASFQELIGLAKKRSEPLGYVSPGVGSLGHLHAEYWAQKEGIKLQHIPYRGGSQAAQDFIAGHVQLGSMTWTSTRAQVRAGLLLPLVISSRRRQMDFPDVPTFGDLGYAELTTTTWWSLSGPAGIPPDRVQTLNREIRAMLAKPEIQKRLAQDTIETEDMTADAFTRFVADEIKKWGPIAKTAIAAGRN